MPEEFYEVRKSIQKDCDGIPREQYRAVTCYAERSTVDSVDSETVFKAPFDEMIRRWSEEAKDLSDK